MTVKLNDIIDLEYLMRQDDDLVSEAEIQSCIDRDRRIFNDLSGAGKDRKALVSGWLGCRRQQETATALPGTMFTILHRVTGYIMAAAGVAGGGALTASFLAYHGNRPVNVTLFAAVFIVLPFIITCIAAIAGMRRILDRSNRSESSFAFSPGSALVSAVMFTGLPKMMKRLDWDIINKGQDTAILTAAMLKTRAQIFKGLFYWPFFILTSIFSMGFSAGALGITFFKVMVSDMAFGWQSTILTSSAAVHELVSLMARPWSLWVPEGLAFPGLEQIEGSRIVLKDGISVLATQDLVSWWPFLCMGLLFYGLIPRVLLTFGAMAAQKRALSRYDFDSAVFNDLIVRMKSPVLAMEVDEIPVSRAAAENPIKKLGDDSEMSMPADRAGQETVLLLPEQIYSQAASALICHSIEQGMGFRVCRVIPVKVNFQADERALAAIDTQDADRVIIVQEVWQPPIRGLLHYLTQVAEILPQTVNLQVLLTNEAGLDDLGVDTDDINLSVWKKAVFTLGNPRIRITAMGKAKEDHAGATHGNA